MDIHSVKIILASRSPRRKQLLRQIGLSFEERHTTVEEILDVNKTPVENVLSLSSSKVLDAARSVRQGVVVGFDTIVVLDSHMLGKPNDAAEAENMLRMLSGREHEVYTGFTIVEKPSGRHVSEHQVTKVQFRHLGDEEIRRYVQSGSPLDKAGAYGIQDDMGAVFVERINGDFYNVMGLPLTKFYVTLQQFLANSH